jgi:hypothetical protein
MPEVRRAPQTNRVAHLILVLAVWAFEPRTDFIALSREAADALLRGARHELPDDGTIIYGVFTPVGKPGTSSPFGRMFAEPLTSRPAQNCVKVVEGRLW